MGDKISTETVDEREPADRYGDVALGVECAWPQDIHVMAATEERAFRHASISIA